MTTRPAMTIESVANPRVKRVLKLRKPRERRVSGLLLAEGRREVERALAAGLVCHELWVCEAMLGEAMRDGHLVMGAAQVYAASSAVFRKLAWHADPEGLLGVFDAPRWALASLPAVTSSSLYLVAVGTEKPGNLGAMVRTAAAAGCDAVLAVSPSVDVFNPSSIRNSTGAVFGLPVVVVPEAEAAMAWLRSRGVTMLSAVAPGQGGGSCFEAAWDGPAAVVVGPEHAGLDEAWRSAAEVLVTVPMASVGRGGGVDSLNASTAAAVLLFEAVRRRSENPRKA